MTHGHRSILRAPAGCLGDVLVPNSSSRMQFGRPNGLIENCAASTTSPDAVFAVGTLAVPRESWFRRLAHSCAIQVWVASSTEWCRNGWNSSRLFMIFLPLLRSQLATGLLVTTTSSRLDFGHWPTLREIGLGILSSHAAAGSPLTMSFGRRQRSGLVRGCRVTINAPADMFRIRSAPGASSPRCRRPCGTMLPPHNSNVLRRLPLSGKAPVGVPRGVFATGAAAPWRTVEPIVVGEWNVFAIHQWLAFALPVGRLAVTSSGRRSTQSSSSCVRSYRCTFVFPTRISPPSGSRSRCVRMFRSTYSMAH